ncbi:MAG: tRNA dihydrouridine(20/20a) synthase DusA [Pseudomonadota bacterium]
MPLNAATDAARLSIAPMMEWTDRHCRFFHRRFSARALLYTEMINAAGLVKGDAGWLLDHNPVEHPLALQLGGSEPEMLARATEMAKPRGFVEINLNVGCPSDRVQSGRFGACLMREPELVADCVAAMIAAAGEGGPEITVKCRIGVDDQDPEIALPALVDRVAEAGVCRIVVHARKAWLDGLSPKENRTVPPLDYALVGRLAADRPGLSIALNGGLATLAEARAAMAGYPALSGVMIGRAAYHDPAEILGGADAFIEGNAPQAPVTPHAAVRAMLPYIEHHLAAGGRLNQITRHMLGAFAGRPGARAWRRILSEDSVRDGAGPEVVERALAAVAPAPGSAAPAAA